MLTEHDFTQLVSYYGKFTEMREEKNNQKRAFYQKPLPTKTIAEFGLIYEKLFPQLESVDMALDSHAYIADTLRTHPYLRPYCRVHYHTLQQHDTAKSLLLQSVQSFLEKILNRNDTYNAQYVPSVGVEIEVKMGTPVLGASEEDFFFSQLSGIPASADEYWEFCLQPSTSFVQARAVAELLHAGYVERAYTTENYYPVHMNIGIPSNVRITKTDAGFLTAVLGVVYSNDIRLQANTYGITFQLHHGRSAINNDDFERQVDGVTYQGRLEVRTCALDKNIYRLIHDGAMLGAMLCAHASINTKDEITKQLSSEWNTLLEEGMRLLQEAGIRIDTDVFNKETIALQCKNIRERMESLVRRGVRKARTMVRKPTQSI